MMAGTGWVWKAQEGAEGTGYRLRSGQPSVNHLFGMNIWSYLKEHPQDALHFQRAMSTTLGAADEQIAQTLSENYDLAAGTFVDIGAGIGNLLIALLRRNPGLHAVLFEQPKVIGSARVQVAQAGLAAGCEVVVDDFFGEEKIGARASREKSNSHAKDTRCSQFDMTYEHDSGGTCIDV